MEKQHSILGGFLAFFFFFASCWLISYPRKNKFTLSNLWNQNELLKITNKILLQMKIWEWQLIKSDPIYVLKGKVHAKMKVSVIYSQKKIFWRMMVARQVVINLNKNNEFLNAKFQLYFRKKKCQIHLPIKLWFFIYLI